MKRPVHSGWGPDPVEHVSRSVGPGRQPEARLKEGPRLFCAGGRERGAGGSLEGGKGEKDSEA